MPKITGRALMQLREVGPATGDMVLKKLAADSKTTVDNAQKMLESGKISRETFINAILDTVGSSFGDQGKLGFHAQEIAAENLNDQLTILKDNFKSIFENVDAKPLADAVHNLALQFGPATENGQALRRIMTTAFDDMTKAVDFANEHAGVFIGTLKGILWTVEKIAAVGKGISEIAFIATTGHSYAAAEDIKKKDQEKESATKASIDRTNAQIEELQAKLNAKLASNSALEQSGANAASGFMEGFAKNLEIRKLVDDDIIEEFKNAMQEHSPSRVMFSSGRNAALGYNAGWSEHINIGINAPGMAGAGFGSTSFPSVGGSRGAMPTQVVVNLGGVIFQGPAPQDATQQANFDEAMARSARHAAHMLLEELNHA
jgi:hypothetical protein